jgi:putative spermidine/putrescine transport system substrate-binding protein
MSNRRQFLAYSGTVALSSALAPLLTSCRPANGVTPIQIQVLQGSVSPQVIKAFLKSYPDGDKLKFKPVEQLATLFADLQQYAAPASSQPPKRFPWQQTKVATPPDLVTLGHSWLRQAIATGIIKPIPMDQLDIWAKLPEPWRSLAKTNATGQIACETWGIPYRWGTTLLLYRKDKFKTLDWLPQDWSDLWRTDLGDRLSLLNQSREVIGLTLKKMGYSYNEPNPGAIADLPTELAALHKNVKFYSSTHYLQPLINGDTWLAQAWSQDALSLLTSYPNLGAIVPQSGTALWCDLWVQPSNSKRPFEQLQPWLQFCWETAAANQFAQSTYASSPLIYELPDLAPNVKTNPLISVPPQTFQQSELIQTLPKSSEQQYLELWRKMRQA